MSLSSRGCGAHPRSRGENLRNGPSCASHGGSSPLTRGKPDVACVVCDPQRLIPAHAGKTGLKPLKMSRGTAHPRSRGENFEAYRSKGSECGSSPLTRGKRWGWRTVSTRVRLIPAHAGKTLAETLGEGGPTAHPRSRGENGSRPRSRARPQGSSPLTRGKHFPTCAFTAQIDQILETLELAVSSGSYLIWVACATDAPQDPVRSIGLVLPSSRGAS